MPIDSFNVNIISRVIGTVQGALTPWFRLRSEGIATLLACALTTLTPRTPLGTLTSGRRAGLIYSSHIKYKAVKSLLG